MKSYKKTLLDFLKEYGINIEAIDNETEENLFQKGFEKIPNDFVESIDYLIQYIPGLATDAMRSREATKKAKKLLDGAYKVSITDGMHLAKSKATKDAFRGTLLSDSNNQIAGQAELLKIDDSMKLAKAPQYALSIFDALSAVTGQYYMAEINHKLFSIEDKTDRILGYLENSIKGELWANDQILNEVITNSNYIKSNENQKAAYYQQVLSIRKDSLAKMKLFELQIDRSMKRINSKAKSDDFDNLTNDFKKYYPQYWYTIYLYAKSIYCEIVLGEIDSPIIIEKKRAEVQNKINYYKAAFDKNCQEVVDAVKNAKTFNLRKLPTLGMINRGHSHSDPLLLLLQLYDAVATTENIISDSKESQKNMILRSFHIEMKTIGDVAVLNEQAGLIDEYMSKVCGPIELMKIGNDYYIRYGEDDQDTH